VARVAETAVPDAEFQTAAGQFSGKELADLTIGISLMNAYNRIAISFRGCRMRQDAPDFDSVQTS
jgi:alkylhydroperoxidase family enzyme